MDRPDVSAIWPYPTYLRDHFRRHGARLRVRDVAAHDRSARETIRRGVRFTYTGDTGDVHVGYFEPERSRFTALDDAESVIITHFQATEHYVRTLADSDY
jgi:hypothetical protein